MTPLLVLDNNVYISAVVFGGKPRLIIEAALAGKIRLAIAEPILLEIQAVLEGAKLGFSAAATREIGIEIAALAESVETGEAISVILEDPADNRILECAVAACADAVVSGDRHLLSLQSFRGIPILSPAEGLAEYT